MDGTVAVVDFEAFDSVPLFGECLGFGEDLSFTVDEGRRCGGIPC